MLNQEDYAVIKALQKRGVYIKDIAEEIGMHPKTVSRALAGEGAPARTRKKRGSKLDAYKDTVDRLLSEGVWNAVVIQRIIECFTNRRDEKFRIADPSQRDEVQSSAKAPSACPAGCNASRVLPMPPTPISVNR